MRVFCFKNVKVLLSTMRAVLFSPQGNAARNVASSVVLLCLKRHQNQKNKNHSGRHNREKNKEE